MRALIHVDLADDLTDAEDARAALEARLSEFYPDSTGGFSVPKSVTVAVASDDAIAQVINAAHVALDCECVVAAEPTQAEATAVVVYLWPTAVGPETQERLNNSDA